MSNVKKILYPILLGLILISGLYVMGAIIETSSTNITIVSAISAGAGSAGDLYDVVQKNGTTARYNLTIMLDDTLNVNITGINITVDTNLSAVLPVNDSMYDIGDSFYTNDSTLFNSNMSVNGTRDFGKGTAEIFFGGTTNATYNGTTGVIVSVNLTAQASDEAGGNIDLIPVNWAIRLNLSNFSKPTFNLTTYIDASAPRISNFNLSDGNVTITNASYNYFTIMSNNSLTATVVVTEANLRNINMYYACTSNGTNATLAAGYGNTTMSTSDTASPYLYTATLANADCIENTETQNNLTLIFDLNDRVGFKSNASFFTLDDAAESTSAYRFIVSNTMPTVRLINLTDAAGGAGGDDTLVAGLGRLDGTGDFLATNTLLTLNLEVVGQYLANESRLYYIVNSSVGTTSDEGFFDDGIQVILHTISGNVSSDGIVKYNGTIGKGMFNDTAQNTTVNFLLMVNGSGNMTGGNRYTYRYRGAFGVDGSAPTPTLTAPADTAIDVQHEITYKCSGEDSTGSGVASCLIKFTKPDGTILSYTTCNSKTISGVDTGQGGTYTVNCKATDDTGNSADTASKTFTVIHNSAGSSGGGSGSSGGAAAVVVDVDLTSADSANVGGYTGNVKTFTFGGATHTIKFTEIGDDSVTITIQSNPVVVGLKIGETKKVDLNNDGVDDLEVTLNKITSGKADVTMNKLTEGALKLVEEEKAAAEETPSETLGEGTGETPAEDAGEPPTESTGLSTGMIVAIIIIIVALAGIGYWFIRKRS